MPSLGTDKDTDAPDGKNHTKNIGLVIDYGEDHSFSNSFRGLKNHKLVKNDQDILANIGNIDLTSYVNFNQVSEVAKTNQ